MLPVCLLISGVSVAQIDYPSTRKMDHTDNYHGTVVKDPYRWLENDTSAETRSWVTEQNKVSFGFLEKIPYRENMKQRIMELYNYPKYSTPFRNGAYYYYYKNDGLQNQAVLYRQKGLDGKPELVLDPNKLSAEGTNRLAGFVLSKNGRYAAWGISKGGSDWQTWLVRDMNSGKDLADTIHWVKVSGIAWQGDGFYYSRYPSPEKGMELSSKNENHQVWYLKVGTLQSEDELVYEDKSNSQRFHIMFTSEDENYVFLNISDRGKGFDGNALWFRKKGDPDQKFKPIVEQVGKWSYSVVDVINDQILMETNEEAPNGKILAVNPRAPKPENWKLIIPEKPEPIQNSSSAGKRLFVN